MSNNDLKASVYKALTTEEANSRSLPDLEKAYYSGMLEAFGDKGLTPSAIADAIVSGGASLTTEQASAIQGLVDSGLSSSEIASKLNEEQVSVEVSDEQVLSAIEALGIDLGNSDADELALKSVSIINTDFVVPKKNLFNVNDSNVVVGSFINYTSGNLVVNAAYNATGYISVDEGEVYFASFLNQLAYFDSDFEYVSGSNVGNSTGGTVTIPAGVSYIRCSVAVDRWDTYQFELGSERTDYETFQWSIKDPEGSPIKLYSDDSDESDGAIAVGDCSFFKIGKNLFNPNDDNVALGYFVLTTTGNLVGSTSYNTTGFIPVVSGDSYTANYLRFLVWYDESKEYISGVSTSDGSTHVAPSNAAYARCSVGHDSGKWSVLQFESGLTSTEYEEFAYELVADDSTKIQLKNTDEDYLTLSDTHYVSNGYEIALYHETIIKDHLNQKGRSGITLDSSAAKETGASTKLTPSTHGVTINGEVELVGDGYGLVAEKSFNLVVSNADENSACNIQNIGDSYTGRMTWANVINASTAAENLTFSGNRLSGDSDPVVNCEGQGGWTISSYFTVDNGGYLSPFMQPVNSNYLYYGMTSFWIDANSASPTYNARDFDNVKTLFDATTGFKLSPNVNDVMKNNGSYVYWDGSAWSSIESTTFGGFAFSYSRYRTAWNIPEPTIVHILLGTNDFSYVPDSSFYTKYPSYKTNYESMIASILSDTPTAKIIVAIPVSSGRQGTWGTLSTERRKRGYWLLAKNLNNDFGNRESEGIYVLDYHSVVDRVFGFNQAYEEPMSGYSGDLAEELYTSDYTHLGYDGFMQMGNAYMGLIQYLRGL